MTGLALKIKKSQVALEKLLLAAELIKTRMKQLDQESFTGVQTTTYKI
jgi:hypothetical protein